jgi:DNA repair protein RadD
MAHLVQEAIAEDLAHRLRVDRVALVRPDRASVYDNYEIPHGVIQADHWRWKPYERIQVCSVQTLARRGLEEGTCSFSSYDECAHDVPMTSPSS